jgi:hypothetical protein
MNDPNPLTLAEHRRGSIISACGRNGDRRLWVRIYRANTRFRGYLSPKARFELEAAGNRVTFTDGAWHINPTGQQTLEGFR